MKKRLIAIACLLFAAMLAFFAAAQAEETPDVLLTDAITDAAVLRYIKNNYTVSDDYYMTQEDLEKVDTICLDFAYSSMVSLDGISIFPNLTDLTVLSNSNITSLSLAGLNKLESLVVSDCPVLTTVDFSNNTSTGFRSADMGGNGITSIITNGSLPVQRLNVNNNPLKSLDLSNFAQLQQFYGFNCGLEKLILPQTSTLEVVCCYSNKISSLNLSGCSGLKELDAHANQIAELALPATSNLKEMDLCGNRLTSLVLSGCGDLTNLDCSENRLSEIDITACPNLHIHSSYFGAQGTDVYLKPINVIATADQAAESWNENDTYVKVNGTPLWSPVTKVSAVYSKADKTITFEASATTTGTVDWFWMLIDGSGNPLDEQGGEGLDDGSALRSVWDLTALELTDEELDYVISLLPEAEAIFVIRDYNCGSYTRIKLSGFGPEIMSITLPPIVAAGENASFEVEAEGSGTLTYQWEVSADNGATWSACTADSAKTASLSIKAEGALDGNLYRCVVTDEGGSTTSPEIPLTVTPGILAQPEAVNAAAGDTVAFSITADGAAGLTYQWQMSKDEGETWSNCSGSSARTASISITPTLTYSGRLYRCVVTDKNGASITSEEAALTVHKALKITAQPVNVTADTGTNAKFTVKAAGEGLTYQWKYRKTAESKWAKTTATGYDTKTLTIPATLTKNGYQYQCIITDAYGASVTSDAVTLTVHTALKITAQPVNATATAGTNATFTVKATGDGLKYQWQILKAADGTWARTTATGYNTATLTIPATVTKNGYQYRCVITDEYGRDITSEAAVLTVQAALKISTQPVNATAEAGTNAKFTVKAAGDGLTYQWQVLKTADGTWAKTSETGSTTAALTIAATEAKNGWQYRCVIKDQYGKKVTSDAATLTVKQAAALTITSQPASVTADAGANAKFTVKATGDGLKYQWQYRTSADGSWAKTTETGSTTATLTIAATEAKTGYQYRCVITDENGKKVTSKAATLTVNKAAALSITTQPKSQTVEAGTNVKFTVKAAGEGLKYQWQCKTSADGSWAKITDKGYNTATLTISAKAAKNGYQYRCVITDENGKKVTSKAATLTVQ